MIRLPAISAIAFAIAMGPAFGEVSSAELDAISIPDKVETAIGTLEFFDGVPTDATVATIYDNLDRMRGMQVFLDNVGAVSLYAVRKGLADAGTKGANRIALFADLMNSETGCRPFRARAGLRSFGCMARRSPGSTRAGGPARSNWSNDIVGGRHVPPR